ASASPRCSSGWCMPARRGGVGSPGALPCWERRRDGSAGERMGTRVGGIDEGVETPASRRYTHLVRWRPSRQLRHAPAHTEATPMNRRAWTSLAALALSLATLASCAPREPVDRELDCPSAEAEGRLKTRNFLANNAERYEA